MLSLLQSVLNEFHCNNGYILIPLLTKKDISKYNKNNLDKYLRLTDSNILFSLRIKNHQCNIINYEINNQEKIKYKLSIVIVDNINIYDNEVNFEYIFNSQFKSKDIIKFIYFIIKQYRNSLIQEYRIVNPDSFKKFKNENIKFIY